MKKNLLSLFVLTILASGILLTSCKKDDNNKDDNNTSQQTEQQFQEELDQALSWAQVYGPPTQSLAEEVAARHNGKTSPLNYTTSEATREYYKKLCLEYHSHFDPDFTTSQ